MGEKPKQMKEKEFRIQIWDAGAFQSFNSFVDLFLSLDLMQFADV